MATLAMPECMFGLVSLGPHCVLQFSSAGSMVVLVGFYMEKAPSGVAGHILCSPCNTCILALHACFVLLSCETEVRHQPDPGGHRL